MLHGVKRCNVKYNSESVFRYFASAVNSNQRTKCDIDVIEKIFLLSVVIEAFKKWVMFLCTPFANHCWYTATGLYITLHSPSARLDSIHPMQIHLIGIRDSGFGIHLITTVSVTKRLSLYEFTLLGRDLVSVVRTQREYVLQSFFERKYVRILLGHQKLSVIERCPYREVRLYLVYRAKIFKEN